MPSKKSRRKARERRHDDGYAQPLPDPEGFEMIEPYPPPRFVCDACEQTDLPIPTVSPPPTPTAKEAAALAPSCVIC